MTHATHAKTRGATDAPENAANPDSNEPSDTPRENGCVHAPPGEWCFECWGERDTVEHSLTVDSVEDGVATVSRRTYATDASTGVHTRRVERMDIETALALFPELATGEQIDLLKSDVRTVEVATDVIR